MDKSSKDEVPYGSVDCVCCEVEDSQDSRTDTSIADRSLPATRRDPPDLHGALRVRGKGDPASVRRPFGLVLFRLRSRELLLPAYRHVDDEQLTEAICNARIHQTAAIR